MLASRFVSDAIWDMSVTDGAGDQTTLDRYRGHVLLVVNVASRCRWTPQYAGLEALYRRYRDDGFAVLAFPCNQFGGQEPGEGTEIAAFCACTYDVTFPVFARLDVNGPNAHPLYRFMKARRKGLLGTGAIKWNFTKFLIDRRGVVISRFAPMRTPSKIEPAIERLISRRVAPGR
jgi:glutathione peroxidase